MNGDYQWILWITVLKWCAEVLCGSVETVEPMEEIPSEEKDKILSQDTKLAEDSSDSSLINHQLKALWKVVLLGLTTQQQQVEWGMILKEVDTFIADDTEIGDVNTHKMKIQLENPVLVQNNYNCIQKPFYKEIKDYVEDLLNRDWIVASESNYSAPAIAVHKRDGTLQLCCDYWALNRKTYPDQQPLPNLQDTLDSLGGDVFLCVLDQSKLYHQLYMDKE